MFRPRIGQSQGHTNSKRTQCGRQCTGSSLIGYSAIKSSFKSHIHVKTIHAHACLPVCSSLCPHRKTRLQLDGFSGNFIFFIIFRKSVEKIQDSLRSDKNNGHFT